MLESLEGYLDNIAEAATQTAEKGGPPEELAASLAILVDTVARLAARNQALVGANQCF